MISKRIKLIASLIKNDESVIDVGCDHAYLALNLKDNGHTERILCIDNKEGPLLAAFKTINQYNLNNTEVLLSNGLEKVNEKFDVVVLAGMGFHTVIDIINQKKEFINKAIIQVNNDVNKMRSWLINNGYKIIDERIIHEYKWYEILVVEKGQQELSEEEIELGKINLERKEKVFYEYVLYRINKIDLILQKTNNKQLLRKREMLKNTLSQ